jgi:hypothetical protein
MSRFLTSIGILTVLIVICILSLLLLKSECGNYRNGIAETAAAISVGDTEAALAAYDRLDADWKHFEDVTGIFTDGSKLDAVRIHMAVLRPLIESGSTEAAAELECVRRLIASIYEEELPYFWHIL